VAYELPRTIEHRSSGPGRWLRERRLRLAIAIALVEGLLVVVDVIPAWLAIVVGLAAVLFYLLRGRDLRADVARQTSWIAAASQVLVALIPLLMFVLTALAVVALAILAVVALFILLGDRR
jgi:hypothetical protein